MSIMSSLRRGSAESAAAPSFDNANASVDCVAFIADMETEASVKAICGLRYPGMQALRGGTREAVDYLAAGAPPKLLIIDVSDSARPMAALLPIIAAFAEDTRVIALGSVNDINLYREMTESGIVDYLIKPVDEKALGMALDRAEKPKVQPGAAGTAGKADEGAKRSVVAVLGTRGGVGASSATMNLAWVLANDLKRDTILLDLDLQDGSIALALDVEPSHGLREVLDNPSRIDSLFVTSVGIKSGHHLTIMAAEEAVDDEVHYDATAVQMLIEELKRQAPCVVIDVPRKASAARNIVLAAASEIVVITDMTLAGLRDAIRLQTMITQVASSARLIFVANRDGGRESTVSKSEFEKALGRKIDYIVPEDIKAHQTSANAGKPVVAAAANSKVAPIFKAMAASIAATADGNKKKAKKSFFAFGKK